MTRQNGTPEMAAHLQSLYAPEDMCPFFPVLVEGHVSCGGCGQRFVWVGDSAFHPNTPALTHAQNEVR